MIRQVAAVVVALTLSTSPLYAQGTPGKLTVSEASASVHKSPSTGSPVIGKAPRGTELVVTREVGDWVKVSWPSAADGAGYVRANALARADAPAAAAKAPATTAKAAPATTKAAPATAKTAATAKAAAGAKPAAAKTAAANAKAAPAPAAAKAAAAETPAPVGSKAAVTPTATPAPVATSTQLQTRPTPPASSLYVAPTHTFGVGVLAGGSSMGFGASARTWKKNRLGLQLEVSRYSFDSVDMLSRATSTDLAPGLLFAMNDRVTDYLWLRPYVGVAGHLVHSSRTDLIFTDQTESANTFGGRVFLGAEMAFSSLPKFAFSADAGYYHLPDPFVGLEPGGMGFSISGHWYLK